jgi:hypothetical protein
LTKKTKKRSERTTQIKQVKKSNELTEEDIFEETINPEFKQPFNNKKCDDYIAICNKIITNIDNLCDTSSSSNDKQNKLSKNSNSSLNEMKQDMTKIKNKLQQIIDIGKCFNRRDIMISSFCNTAYNILGKLPATKDDFDRKYHECPRALENLFDDDIYGNPIGTSINFIFQKIDPTKMIFYVDQLRQSTELPIEKRLLFGSYRLDKIYKDDWNTRSSNINTYIRYCMIMTEIDTNMSIKCYILNKNKAPYVRVKTIDCYSSYVFDCIPDLVLRRVVSCENLTKYIKKLFEQMPRKSRVAIWEYILNIMTKEIDLLNQGYKMIDIGENKMIKFSIETKEVCPITTIQPPYTKIHLVCDHSLSVMAIYGIIYEGESQDTQSILCPMCRCNLIPKLVPALSDEEFAKFHVKTYQANDLKNDVNIDVYNFEKNKDKPKIYDTHNEADKFIDSIFMKKNSIAEIQNSDNDTDIMHDEDDDASVTANEFMTYLASMALLGTNNQ